MCLYCISFAAAQKSNVCTSQQYKLAVFEWNIVTGDSQQTCEVTFPTFKSSAKVRKGYDLLPYTVKLKHGCI